MTAKNLQIICNQVICGWLSIDNLDRYPWLTSQSIYYQYINVLIETWLTLDWHLLSQVSTYSKHWLKISWLSTNADRDVTIDQVSTAVSIKCSGWGYQSTLEHICCYYAASPPLLLSYLVLDFCIFFCNIFIIFCFFYSHVRTPSINKTIKIIFLGSVSTNVRSVTGT